MTNSFLNIQTTAFIPPALTNPARHATLELAAASPLSVSESMPVLSGTTTATLANAASDVVRSTPQTFEAVAPDTSLLVGFGAVVLLCIAAGSVWANDVVPVSRTKLAISKNRGEVKEYLDGLKTDSTSLDDIDTTTSSIEEMDMDTVVDKTVKPNVGDGRDFERWLFSDWLNKPDAKGGRQKEPALPILKEAKWNSGDNPVLVTAAIMMLGVVLASITERIAT